MLDLPEQQSHQSPPSAEAMQHHFDMSYGEQLPNGYEVSNYGTQTGEAAQNTLPSNAPSFENQQPQSIHILHAIETAHLREPRDHSVIASAITGKLMEARHRILVKDGPIQNITSMRVGWLDLLNGNRN